MSVLTVADARAGLSGLIARFRHAPDASPVVIGSHRKPEAVLLSHDAYVQLASNARGVSLQRLKELAPVIERLAAGPRLADVRVYGSVARGEQQAGSDVDLFVAPQPDATLFDIAQFEMDMEVLLGVAVSAVSDATLDAVRDASVLDDAVSL